VPQSLVSSRVLIDRGNINIQRCVGPQLGRNVDRRFVDHELPHQGLRGSGISGCTAPGPHLIRGNYIEAAGINVMWGGATPSIPNMRAYDVTDTAQPHHEAAGM
jgi:hypothetical protein